MLFKVVVVLALAVTAVKANNRFNVTVPATGTASFHSLNYPEPYPNIIRHYIYNVVGPAGSGLEFNAETFSMHTYCSLSRVKFTEVINNNMVFLGMGSYCGPDSPNKVRSSTNKVTVYFTTGYNYGGATTGFKINVKVAACAFGSDLCPGSDSLCLAPNQYCDGTPDCPNGTDEENCPELGSCGKPSIFPTLSRFQSLIQEMIMSKAGKIVGGTEAVAHSWPWQVVMLTSADGGSFTCGGSILNNEWIMTAAHCCMASAPVPSKYKVRVGVHSRKSTSEAGAATMALSRLVVYPGYEAHPVPQNDFCLLKTSMPMIISKTVSPVCLSDVNDGPVGQKCWVTGWGETRGSRFNDVVASIKAEEAGIKVAPRAISDTLQQVEVDVVSNTVCDAAYEFITITPQMICAASPGKDSCQGDSGGPLVCQDEAGNFKLVGVVSWGRGCAMAGYPGVYARTSTALDWIMTTMNS